MHQSHQPFLNLDIGDCRQVLQTLPAESVQCCVTSPAPLVCAELDYLWWGVCIGGRHYTGHIVLRNPYRKIELIRRRSAKEAKEMAEREGRMWLARERETNKFDTLKQIERFAAKWCEANLGDNWVLLYDVMNPSVAIAGKGWIVPRLKSLTRLGKAWAKVPNHKRDFNHPGIKAAYRVWNDLLKEPNSLPGQLALEIGGAS